MRKHVYNLEFRDLCQEMTVFGYGFSRVAEYGERIASLQHHVGSPRGSEFPFPACDGQHAVTAYVDLPDHEQEAALGWQGKNPTALDDILLLLSLFTGRNVFTFERRDEQDVIFADPRQYFWGGILECSIPYRASHVMSDDDALLRNFPLDTGLEEGLNAVYALIRTEEWQRKYARGHFLLLARQAFHLQPIESAFIQCWTIWEHLFAVLNRQWLLPEHVRRVWAPEKIAFVLTTFGLREEVDKQSRKRIESLAEIRNTLIHSGRFPDPSTRYDDAVLFIRMTNLVIAKSLGLVPSTLFRTMDRLEQFLRSGSTGEARGDSGGGQERG